MTNTQPYPTADEMMAQAQAQTGLSNFGPPSFIPGLKRVLQSLEEDANLTPEGRDMVLSTFRRRLITRLQIEDWIKDHPESLDLPLTGPISITGLPRTGTTALAGMMSLDPQFRCLRMWEQLKPCPPPELATEENDPRRLEFIRQIDDLIRAQPEQKAMHIYEIDSTVEDTEILSLEFSHQTVTMPAYGYTKWWRERDMRPVYAYHRRIISILQSKRPPNFWLFKAPHHKFHLEHFADIYPDARFIFTHRDPAKSVPSYASFVRSLYPPGSADNTDKQTIGRNIHSHLLDGMKRAMAARDRLGEHRFVDVHHSDLESDPIRTLQRAYDALGLKFTPEMQASVLKWQEVNHSGAHGTHRYTAEQYGLSKDQIRADYDFYLRRFDVAVER